MCSWTTFEINVLWLKLEYCAVTCLTISARNDITKCVYLTVALLNVDILCVNLMYILMLSYVKPLNDK